MTTCAMNGYRSGTGGTHSVVALQTNLHDLGIDDKTIQAILRHSSVSATQKCYIKTLPPQSVAAMNKLESALCSERALEGVSESIPHRPN